MKVSRTYEQLPQLLLQLGLANDEDALLREAVPSARDLLGIDRIGIWKLCPEAQRMHGTFGIDEEGQLRDERHSSYSISADSGGFSARIVKDQLWELIEESKSQRTPAFRLAQGDLGDHTGRTVGKGDRATVSLWGGRAVRGFLFCDNLLTHRPIGNEKIAQLLVLCAAIGQNLDRIEALDKLRKTTLRLERERSLTRSVIDTVDEVVFARDINGRYIFANEAWRRMNPCIEIWPVADKTLEEVFSPEDAEKRRGRDRRVIEAGGLFREVHSSYFNGVSNRVIENNGYPVRDADGSIFAVAYVLRDITDEVNHRNELQVQKELAETALRTKANFIAVMNHELRTPLNTIFGPLEFLEDTELDEDQREMVLIAQESSRHLLRVVENILDIARIEEGRLEAHCETFSLADFLQERMNPLRNLAESKGLYLQIHLEENIPSEIWSDEYLLSRILINLVGNSLKFTRTGGVTIRARREKPYLKIEVIDTGIGIPEEEHQRLFRAFEQAQSKGGSKIRGTGLGLAICKELTECLGGTISLTSEEGKGSCFTLMLPFEGAEIRRPESGL